MDRVTVAAARFVSENLGERFVRPPVLDYKDLLQRSNPLTPIVFVLSPGADPAFGIFRLGESCQGLVIAISNWWPLHCAEHTSIMAWRKRHGFPQLADSTASATCVDTEPGPCWNKRQALC